MRVDVTYANVTLAENTMEEASNDMQTETETETISPPRKHARKIVLGGILVVAMIVGSLAIQKATMPTNEGAQPKNAEDLFDAEVSAGESLVTEFMTSRRLAQTMAANFEVECAPGEPVCNPEIAFATSMQKFVQRIKEFAPELYKLLAENKIPEGQQELIMRVLPLAKNKKILELGQVFANTQKRWAKSGSKVVMEKMKEALDEYLQKHGSDGMPSFGNPSQPTFRNASWQPQAAPYLLDLLHGNGTERRLQAELQNKVVKAIRWGIAGIQILLPLVVLLLQILDYNGVVHLSFAFKIAVLWWDGFSGSIECLTIALCPFVFLGYC